MTTCRDIITLALSRGRIIRPGGVPKDGEATEGLSVLQGLYEHWLSVGTFGRLVDRVVTEDTTANPGERIRVDGTYTVTLADTIEDEGEIYPPFDLSAIEIVHSDPYSREISVYEFGRGQWVRLDGLALDDEAPLASRGRLGLADCLASYWIESFGAEMPRNVAMGAQGFMRSIVWKIGGDVERSSAEYF